MNLVTRAPAEHDTPGDSGKSAAPQPGEIRDFMNSCQTVQLATLSEAGLPNASYAPFAEEDGRIYVLISDLARHTQNLQQYPLVSMMFVEDESAAKTVFARHRLTYSADARIVERDNAEYEKGIAALALKHGDMIASLSRSLDFRLFALQPKSGLYVKGFARAYEINGEDPAAITWMTDGHEKL